MEGGLVGFGLQKVGVGQKHSHNKTHMGLKELSLVDAGTQTSECAALGF